MAILNVFNKHAARDVGRPERGRKTVVTPVVTVDLKQDFTFARAARCRPSDAEIHFFGMARSASSDHDSVKRACCFGVGLAEFSG
jgi:hypothetical protein